MNEYLLSAKTKKDPKTEEKNALLTFQEIAVQKLNFRCQKHFTHFKILLFVFGEERSLVWNVFGFIFKHVRNNRRTSSAIKTS